MPFDRYYVDFPLAVGDTIPLEGMEFHHLSHVMRKKIGDGVELVNGKGGLAKAAVIRIEKRSALLRIQTLSTCALKPTQKILAQAIPKLARLEFILEKGTELGASAFWLFPGIWSEKEDFSRNQQLRMQLITITAMKQCGRLDLPSICFKPPLAAWEPLRGESFEGASFFGDTRENAPFFTRQSTLSSTLFFIGPEKGFHPGEIDILENKLLAQGVKLHENVLRVDTAALVALALN